MPRIGNNIYLRKDGRYEGRIANGFKDNGKCKYRSVYGKTYNEVLLKLQNIKNEVISSESAITLTVKELFSEWCNAIKSRVKESTMANYKMKIEKHLLPVFGDFECSSISAKMVSDFINKKISNGLSAKYVSDIVVLLKSAFKYAAREYDIHNPISNIIMPRKENREILLLDHEQQNTLLSAINKINDQTSLGIMTAMYTGLRLGELCALKWEDIDLKKRTITVKRTIQRICESNGERKTRVIITDPKSSSSKRVIPIPLTLINHLEKEQKNGCYFMTGTPLPLDTRTLQYRFQALLKKVNLPSIHFHALRHMFATNCIRLGCDVKTLSELLGHSSVEVTLNRYVHSSFDVKRKFMEKLNYAA